MITILYAALILGGIGLILGLLLGVASKYLAVEKDPRYDALAEALPGANCGGCGYAGCGAYADAVLEGAPVNRCSVGGKAVAERLAEIMGVSAGDTEQKVARVLCRGTCGVAGLKYIYEGAPDCFSARHVAGGPKLCNDGCLGYGTCTTVCRFGAISLEDGVAVVDEEKCVGCGACVSFCPKKVIVLTAKAKPYYVACANKEKGAVVKNECAAGCIACRICEKNCPSEAITVEDNIAVIDPAKCTACGLCQTKCPRKIIQQAVEG